jgi:predicted DNA-binding transcriptional regulator AlpA
MDANQTKIIELLREVHLIAFKEIERLNLRIAELENRQPIDLPKLPKQPTADVPPPAKVSEMMTEHQVAEFLNMSVASVRRWRLFRTGPKFVKIGSAVRYKRHDIEMWLDSCPGMR